MKYFIFLLLLLIAISPSPAQWQIQNSGTSENLNDLEISDYMYPSTAVVVGNKGTILITTNYGIEWNAKNSGTMQDLNAVSFCCKENGIAVGYEVICLTTDGGESWSASPIDKNAVTVYYYLSIDFGYNIIIGCSDGTILYSGDSGNTWQDTVLTNESIIAIGMTDYGIYVSPVFVVTNSFTAITYLPIHPSSVWKLYDNPINYWDNLNGGELNWETQYLVGFGGNPGSVPLFLEKSRLDTSWTRIYSFIPSPFVPLDIAIYEEQILFICGSDGKIFNSDDGGDSWTQQFTGTAKTLNSVAFGHDSIGYSAGENGTILFTSNGGVNSVEGLKPVYEYQLYQNYPNPFNPSTKIKFIVPSNVKGEMSNVSLNVYDVLGNEITLLVNEQLSPGEYEVEFDASSGSSFRLVPSGQSPGGLARNLSSGIYFYTLRAGNPSTSSGQGFMQTKKMIYLK